MKPKSRRILSERVGTVVARGDAALGLQQVSELLPIQGIDYIGPLPAEVQRVTVFSAGIATGSQQPEAAKQLIRYFTSPEAAPAIVKSGLEPAAGVPQNADAMSPPLPPAVVSAFAPTGTLRASINLGNPILASKDAATGEPVGVSVDLARAFAERLGVAIELVVFEKAAASVDAVRNEQADIGFFAIDPARSEGLRFTAPYVLIEGSYLVPAASPLAAQRGGGPRRHRASRSAPAAPTTCSSRARSRRRRSCACRAPRACSRACTRARSRWRPASGRCSRPRPRATPGLRLLPGPLHGDPAGDGHARLARRGGGGGAGRLRRGDEGQRLRGRGAGAPSHPGRQRGAAAAQA